MIFLTSVLQWRDSRDSSTRISAREADTGREFLLNTNRISDLRDLSTLVIPRCSFNYSDNPGDRREGLSYVECDLSSAQVITQFDTAPHSYAITLPIVPYNHPWGSPHFPLRPPVNTTIGIWAIAWVTRYNPDPDNYVWVCYYKGSFKRLEVLVSLNLEQFEDIIQTGTTTSTSTSTTKTSEGRTTEPQ